MKALHIGALLGGNEDELVEDNQDGHGDGGTDVLPERREDFGEVGTHPPLTSVTDDGKEDEEPKQEEPRRGVLGVAVDDGPGEGIGEILFMLRSKAHGQLQRLIRVNPTEFHDLTEASLESVHLSLLPRQTALPVSTHVGRHRARERP